MYDQVSVFEVLAADDQASRTTSRQALALAKVRVDNSLGQFLRAAQSEEEFAERLALVADDFTHIVANSSAEVGHEHPEHIAVALRDHYHATSKIAAGVDFTKPPTDEDEDGSEDEPDDEDDGKPPWLKSKSHRKQACGPCDAGDCKDCEGKGCDCSKCRKESRWTPRGGKRLAESDRASASPKVHSAGYAEQGGAGTGGYPQMDQGEEQGETCAHCGSPSMHPGDQYSPPHCLTCGEPSQPHAAIYDPLLPANAPRPEPPNFDDFGDQLGGALGMGGRGAANNPSDQDDHASREVSCPECGGDGKTAGAKECGKCKGKGKVPNFGDSMLDATFGRWQVVAEDGNTDLDGPEPKMDKGKWTPTNPAKYEEDSKRWPNKEKDIIEPIKAVNDDPLKEIGEQTTEEKKLPSETENSGFQTGGEDKGPHTDTWHGKDGQQDPVTHDKQSRVNPLRELLGQDGPSDAVVTEAFAKLI